MRLAAVAGGWLLAAAIVWLSLTPEPPMAPSFDHGDKAWHFLAYGALMFWFALLYRAGPARAAYALLWIAMGAALEYAQGATGTRSMELGDMAANTLGVLAGALAALSFPRGAAAAGTGKP